MILTSSPLLTDLYQLTMMQAYYDRGYEEEAVFELFFRKLPAERPFMVACGLEQALEFLDNLHFSDDEIDYLHKQPQFHDDFLDRLKDFSFTGSINAMAEGTVFFADEPVMRVTAPLPQAQLVETRLINIIQYQTMIASKAVRMTRLLPDRVLVDYGLRRSHGAEAGIFAARSAYLAGFAGTATVLAGKYYDIPVYGTMAHSFVQAHDSEEEAFYNYATSHPDNCVLLIDTYDTERAARRVIELSKNLKKQNISIKGVRLDSGDMVQLSKTVRKLLDDAGLNEVLIFASGDLDEYELEKFRDAPVDGFGIGSKMTTSADHPYCNSVYKLVEYKGEGRRKLAKKKATWPGRKQIFRQISDNSLMCGDVIGLAEEALGGTPLIHHYMKGGTRLGQLPSLTESREFLQQQLALLPADIDSTDFNYPVSHSEKLQTMADQIAEKMR